MPYSMLHTMEMWTQKELNLGMTLELGDLELGLYGIG